MGAPPLVDLREVHNGWNLYGEYNGRAWACHCSTREEAEAVARAKGCKIRTILTRPRH